MKSYRNIQIVVTVVFFLVMGIISTGFADGKTNLKPVQKKILTKTTPAQKTKPILTPGIKAQRLSDLIISKIQLSPNKKKNSNYIPVWVFVKNIGKGKSSPSLLKISSGKKFQPLIPVPALSRNQSWRYIAKVNLSKDGSCNVKATINPKKKIAETNYNNNTLGKKLRIKPRPMSSKRKSRAPGLTPPNAPDSQTLQARPIEMTMTSKYSVEILEFNVRQEQDGYVWEAVLKNTGSDEFGFMAWFIRVYQISKDGSEQMAGNEWIMNWLSPGDTVTKDSGDSFERMADASKLRMEIWKNHSSGNHILITKKVFPFPIKFLTAFKEVKVMDGVLPEITRSLKIKSSEYLGQGRWSVEVENTGNSIIYFNELSVTARYFMGGDMPESRPFLNTYNIGPSKTATIAAHDVNLEVECRNRISNIDIFVHDLIKDKTYYSNIYPIEYPSAIIDHVTLKRSIFGCNLENTSPYPVKVKIKIEEIEIWDAPKPYPDENDNIFEEAWDFITNPGMEFDARGLQPEELKCRAADIELGSITLPGTTSSGPYGAVKTFGVSGYTLNQLLREKCPGVIFSNYSYVFKNMKIKLYTENVSGCQGTSQLGWEVFDEGGSQNNPAFAW